MMQKTAILGACFMLSSWMYGANSRTLPPITQATALSEVFGDGAKITTAILQYDEDIDGTSLSIGAFKAAGREITDVYTSKTADKGKKSPSGPYVVITLKSETELQPVRPEETQGRIQGPVAGQKGMGPKAGRPGLDQKKTVDSVSITQMQPIRSAQGKEIQAQKEPVIARNTRTLVADDFTQADFPDRQTGINLAYNLFTPKHPEPGKKYPLVLFIHDASGAGKGVKNTLLQGDGATVWATPESQAQHPCFVLAPQFAEVTVDDDFNTTPDLDACLNLVDSLMKKYPIDPDRVYTTGQSMGCMSSYVLMLRRPELFASAMLVAGQWDPSVMAPLARKNLWLQSCKGDVKSSEGVAQAIQVWEKNGAAVTEQEWPLDTTAEARAEEVNDMLRHGGNIHYTHFAGGSHNNTWRIAYDIEGVRNWLFAQHRPIPTDSLVGLLHDLKGSTVFVAANHGDFHGTRENSIQALIKAVQKGATIALVDVKEENGNLLLGSGEKLEDALAEVRNQILLLVNPASENVAEAVAQLADKEKATSQFLLYGSNFGTQLNYVARFDLGHDNLDEVLSGRPIAVELHFTDNQDPALITTIERIKAVSRVCFNTTTAGLSGTYSDEAAHSNPRQNAWKGLIDLGGTVILTNQIKPLLNSLNGI
ncbi:MAG: prolyl oligopeptidase family serine peptidase [Paraprevotella sp.]|nr:prolyl oligopeptidase family serine peptidase [Paraprevotella sp.]